MKRKLFAALAVVFACALPALAGNKYYVKVTGSATADCLSWATAGTLKRAVALASDPANGGSSWADPTEIIIEGGTAAEPITYNVATLGSEWYDLQATYNSSPYGVSDYVYVHPSTDDREGTIFTWNHGTKTGTQQSHGFLRTTGEWKLGGFTMDGWCMGGNSCILDGAIGGTKGTVPTAPAWAAILTNTVVRNCNVAPGFIHTPRVYDVAFESCQLSNGFCDAGGFIGTIIVDNQARYNIDINNLSFTDCTVANGAFIQFRMWTYGQIKNVTITDCTQTGGTKAIVGSTGGSSLGLNRYVCSGWKIQNLTGVEYLFYQYGCPLFVDCDFSEWRPSKAYVAFGMLNCGEATFKLYDPDCRIGFINCKFPQGTAGSHISNMKLIDGSGSASSNTVMVVQNCDFEYWDFASACIYEPGPMGGTQYNKCFGVLLQNDNFKHCTFATGAIQVGRAHNALSIFGNRGTSGILNNNFEDCTFAVRTFNFTEVQNYGILVHSNVFSRCTLPSQLMCGSFSSNCDPRNGYKNIFEFIGDQFLDCTITAGNTRTASSTSASNGAVFPTVNCASDVQYTNQYSLVRQCVFKGNTYTVQNSCGLIPHGYFENCTFENETFVNSPTSLGLLDLSSASRCTFKNISCGTSAAAAAGSQYVIMNCNTKNYYYLHSCRITGCKGGLIGNGGVLYNCLIDNNDTPLAVSGSFLNYCTVANNTGSGWDSKNGNNYLCNSIVYGNNTSKSAGCYDVMRTTTTGATYLKNSLWGTTHQGTANGFYFDANSCMSGVDPLFVNAANGDFQLSADSPAKDKGGAANQFSAAQIVVDGADLKYGARKVGAAEDMGCYEYSPTPAVTYAFDQVSGFDHTNGYATVTVTGYAPAKPVTVSLFVRYLQDGEVVSEGPAVTVTGTGDYTLPGAELTSGERYTVEVVSSFNGVEEVVYTEDDVAYNSRETTNWVHTDATPSNIGGAWSPTPAIVAGAYHFGSTDAAAFQLNSAKTMESAGHQVALTFKVCFDGTIFTIDAQEAPPAEARAALTAADDANGDSRWYAYIGGAWTQLDGAGPAYGVYYTVEAYLDYVGNTVQFFAAPEGETPVALTLAGESEIDLAGSGNGLAAAGIQGACDLKSIDGSLLNRFVATVGGTEYATIADALAAGNEVTLLWDVTVDPDEVGTGTWQIHANGKQLKHLPSASGAYEVTYQDGVLTIVTKAENVEDVATSEKYATVAAAVTAGARNLRLLGDISESSTVISVASVALNLNGYNVNGGEVTYNVATDGELSLTGSGNIDGGLKVTGGTLNTADTVVFTGDLNVTGGSATVAGSVGGDLEVSGGSAAVTGNVGGALTAGGTSVTVGGTVGSTATVSAGTVSVTGAIGDAATITGGTVTFSAQVSGAIEVSGGSLTLDGTAGTADGLTISGGASVSVTSSGAIGGSLTVSNGDLTLAGTGAVTATPSVTVGTLTLVTDQLAAGYRTIEIREGASIAFGAADHAAAYIVNLKYEPEEDSVIASGVTATTYPNLTFELSGTETDFHYLNANGEVIYGKQAGYVLKDAETIVGIDNTNVTFIATYETGVQEDALISLTIRDSDEVAVVTLADQPISYLATAWTNVLDYAFTPGETYSYTVVITFQEVEGEPLEGDFTIEEYIVEVGGTEYGSVSEALTPENINGEFSVYNDFTITLGTEPGRWLFLESEFELKAIYNPHGLIYRITPYEYGWELRTAVAQEARIIAGGVPTVKDFIEDAITNAQNGATVQLLTNAWLYANIQFTGGSYTLDLAGCDFNAAGRQLNLINYGDRLSITNSTANQGHFLMPDGFLNGEPIIYAGMYTATDLDPDGSRYVHLVPAPLHSVKVGTPGNHEVDAEWAFGEEFVCVISSVEGAVGVLKAYDDSEKFINRVWIDSSFDTSKWGINSDEFNAQGRNDYRRWQSYIFGCNSPDEAVKMIPEAGVSATAGKLGFKAGMKLRQGTGIDAYFTLKDAAGLSDTFNELGTIKMDAVLEVDVPATLRYYRMELKEFK